MNSVNNQPIRRRVFVDFMYAIVVGAALPLISDAHLNVRDPVFYGIMFLILVVLEDYFLYETQIARFQDARSFTVIVLMFEIAILISWYLCAVAIPTHVKWFLVSFSMFHVLKFMAGWAHWRRIIWQSLRNIAFLIPPVVALWIGTCTIPKRVVGWVIGNLGIAWLVTIVIWWRVTASKKKLSQPANASGLGTQGPTPQNG